MEFSFMFFLGFLFGSFVLEPIVINFIYFKNIGLFNDLILTKKNRMKLYEYYLNEFDIKKED